MVSDKTVARISLYRRVLSEMRADAGSHIFSHELAAIAGCTAAQVRRDLMVIGYVGSPVRGYEVAELVKSIGSFLDAPQKEGVALVGIGNLGRALLAFFAGRRPNLAIVAAFDVDPSKVARVVHGCRCYPVEELPRVVEEAGIRVGIITVPASEAQGVADLLIRSGVRGLINFAPAPLRVPYHVRVESLDMTTALEKVAYFARQGEAKEGAR